MAKTDFIYDMVTTAIVKKLQEGVVPWHKPWSDVTVPRSIDGHVYRGINPFLLAMGGYESPYWMTYDAAIRHGGNVRLGEKGTVIIYWNVIRVKDPESPDGFKLIPLLRYYRVWNWEQIENVREPKGGAFPNRNAGESMTREERHEAAASIVKGYPNAPTISHGHDGCYYCSSTDDVFMPTVETFDSMDDYYVSLLHELTHSTMHESRLNRQSDHVFGSHSYGREELVAEMGAAFLSAEAGIESTFDNNASYIASWIKTIQEDPKAVIWAAGKAQAAADYILDRKVETIDDESSKQAVAA